jgi:nucleoside-diphosphate-sugar epimerase
MLNTERARDRLGFVGTTSLDAGLHATIAWYREHVAA